MAAPWYATAEPVIVIDWGTTPPAQRVVAVPAAQQAGGQQPSAAYGSMPAAAAINVLGAQPTGVQVTANATILPASVTIQTLTTADVLSAVTSGADPTGAADSTTAIQAALNACPAGGVVYLPAGTYLVSAPLIIPQAVTLRGAHGNTLSTTGYGSVLKASASWAQGTAPSAAMILLNATTEQKITDLMIDGSALPVTADGIQFFNGAGEILVRDVCVQQVTGFGLSTAGTGTCTVIRTVRVTAHQCGAAGFTINATDSTHVEDYALGNTGQGFFIGNGNANSRYIGCRAEWSGTFGFQVAGTWNTGTGAGGVQLVGCSTDRNTRDGTVITASGNSPVLISGHSGRRDGSGSTSSGYAGVTVSGASVPVIIDGLTVFPGVNDDGTGSLTPQYGMNVNGTVTYVAVTNAFLHAVTAGVSGTITNSRAIATRTGATSSPSAVTQVADSA